MPLTGEPAVAQYSPVKAHKTIDNPRANARKPAICACTCSTSSVPVWFWFVTSISLVISACNQSRRVDRRKAEPSICMHAAAAHRDAYAGAAWSERLNVYRPSGFGPISYTSGLHVCGRGQLRRVPNTSSAPWHSPTLRIFSAHCMLRR